MLWKVGKIKYISKQIFLYMKYIKHFESHTNKLFLHGSFNKLLKNTILKPHNDSYTKHYDNKYIEEIMERYKPNDKLSRYNSVFLVDDVDDIDNAGASIDFIYEVTIPDDIIPEKSDLAWYSEIEMTNDKVKKKKYALNYWNGVAFTNPEMSLWEYRVPYAIVYNLVEEN